MSNNANALAFPVPGMTLPLGGRIVTAEGEHGLTKRELFAAMAMQGSLSRLHASALHPRETAANAVADADALLAELERTK